jgi:dipeptidyl aminopeptidase/acylaminoacyl peptidase
MESLPLIDAGCLMKNLVHKAFKKPFFGQFQVPWRWPENAVQEDWRRVEIKSTSGALLSGLLGRCEGQAKGAVLMAHPMGAAAKGFWVRNGHGQLLREAGYHVLTFDLNGFGESSNTNMDYPLDVLSAGQYLNKLYPSLNVAVMGASMGGAMSVCAMSDPSHPFKAAVIESAFPTLLHFWSRYPIPSLALKLSKIVYPAGERNLRPVLAAENLKGQPSMLLIYGDGDVYTPPKDGHLLNDVLNKKTQTEFWVARGAEHTHAYRQQPEEYKKRVLNFLDKELAA